MYLVYLIKLLLNGMIFLNIFCEKQNNSVSPTTANANFIKNWTKNTTNLGLAYIAILSDT